MNKLDQIDKQMNSFSGKSYKPCPILLINDKIESNYTRYKTIVNNCRSLASNTVSEVQSREMNTRRDN